MSGTARARRPGGAPPPAHVAAERRRVGEGQDLGGPEAADAVLAVDPVEQVGEAGPAEGAGGAAGGGGSSLIMKVSAQDLGGRGRTRRRWTGWR